MTVSSGSGITVRKELHAEEAFVGSMAYLSSSRPLLAETLVLSGDRKGEVVRRVSEDNGRTWVETETLQMQEPKGDRVVHRHHPTYYLDEEHGVLIEFVTEYERWATEKMSFGPEIQKNMLEFSTGRIFYRFSRDEGKTWSARKQLIQSGPGYDAVHWADGIEYGKNSCNLCPLARVTKLGDGTLIAPVWFWRLDDKGELIRLPDRFGEEVWPITAVACFRGRWREVVGSLRGMGSQVDAFLRNACEPVALEGNTLVLGFYYEFHKDKIEDPKYRQIVEQKVSEIFGEPYKIS